jgi:MATE family multidrug resistance protein
MLARVRAEVPGILGLAVPIVAGLAASTLIGVVDAVMLAPLGPVPLAAVGLTGAGAGLLYAAVWGTLSALSVRIGAAWGAGEARRIPLILRNGLALGGMVGLAAAAAMGLIWLALPATGQPDEVLQAMPAYWALIAAYLVPFALLTVFKSAFEAVERPWTGAAFAFLGVGLNVPLNWLFIYGPGPFPALGLTGAGVASLLAESLAFAAAWLYWKRAPSMARLRLRRDLDRAEIGAALREGAPLGALYVVETGSVTVATLLIGAFGTVALAGNQVAMSVGGVLYMVPLGVAGAVAIRVAQARGAGEDGALRPIALAALGVATLWLAAAALTLGFRGEAIAALITDDPAVIAVAAQMFLVFAVFQLVDGVQSTMLGALRGLSDTAWPAVVSILAYWVLSLPLGWALARWGGQGPAGIWMGFLFGLIFAAAALIWRFRRQTALPGAP